MHIQIIKKAIDEWLIRHPTIRDVLWWSLPAVILGLIFRYLILDYNPCAYWSKDSYSFINFSYKLMTFGEWEMEDKRRWTYPILLLLSYAGYGGCLRTVALGQHAFGLLTILPLTWIVRKVFPAWKWVVIPVTLYFATHPGYLWFEHCVLAESLFSYFLIWAMAGWVAWTGCTSQEGWRNQDKGIWFWVFFIPFALMMLQKPSGRFFWPGLLLALVIVKAWKYIRWEHGAALLLLAWITPTVGTEGQGLRLLYTTLFPATNLESSKHAQYKEAVRDLVLDSRKNIHSYYARDKEIKNFLEYPAKNPMGGPLWAALEGKRRELKQKRFQLYKELALEALISKPWVPFYVSLQRIVCSARKDYNPLRWSQSFKVERATQGYSYDELLLRPGLLRRLYGFSENTSPSKALVMQLISPQSNPFFADWMETYGGKHRLATYLVHAPSTLNPSYLPLYHFRPTFLGMIFLVGLVISLGLAAYRPTIGVWNCMFLGYLFGVFAVGSDNARFFIPYEFMIALTLATSIDAAQSLIHSTKRLLWPLYIK